MADAQQAARLRAKVENFKSAVEVGKTRHERDHCFRLQRYQTFDERVASTQTDGEEASEASRARALQRFADRERRGVLARCKEWTTDDFVRVRVIGEGTFGIVHLVKGKGTEQYYALKQMMKTPMCRKNVRRGAFAERDLLAEAQSRWFVELVATFQDANNVFMVMEFLAGGDLIGHLIERKRFTKAETQFYMAELLEALDTVHKCGFVHRDVKPDNMVLTSAGHLKLLDFGLCAHETTAATIPGCSVTKESPRGAVVRDSQCVRTPATSRRALLKSIVGTPQYMAPEVYRGASGIESDIWALGIITFECLTGDVPFSSGNDFSADGQRMVRDRVMRHQEVFPRLLSRAMQKGFIRPVSHDFLMRVICERNDRLTAEDCRRDPFFFGIDFPRVHLMTPPIVPSLSGPGDASQFDDFQAAPWPKKEMSALKDNTLEWAHYEFDRKAHDLQRPHLEAAELDELCAPLEVKEH
jgi:serine/threonine protein kinase|eukprot:TRINITY_DN783_c0_g2_i1.p1 TRINITY_DN783_c0_g2~~TRINITY_DN783_c0_g2_i1.p1  ORF type:complete len:470 (+),score=71.72 TRINITY_DN783_c0_g2_i1:24-1433(+)